MDEELPADLPPGEQQQQQIVIPQPRNHVQWNHNWRIVTIEHASSDNFDDHSQDTVILGILLSIKHHSSSSDSLQALRPRNTASGSSFQGLRYSNQRATTYDRIFMFGDVGMPGKCFAILTKSTSDSSKVLRQCHFEDCMVGDYFAILESDSPTSFLLESPILVPINPLIPIARPLSPNEVPLLDPTPGEQRYFLFHGRAITITKAAVVRASCSGTLCDRQLNLTTRNAHCGCMYKGNTAAIALRMNIRFSFVFERQQRSYTVTGFQSWRTTKVFLQPINRSTDTDLYLTDANAIRPTVSAITKMINANGGWTMCGWLRRGEVIDASATSNDANSEVVGTNMPIHLVYVYPSRESVLLEMTNAQRFAPPAMQAAFTYHALDTTTAQDNTEGNVERNV